MKVDSRVTYKPKLFKNKFKNYRLGKFNQSENNYISLLIELFQKGILDIPQNYPLRIFLANCLGRNIMSISKKFTKEKSIGKKRYQLKNIYSSDFLVIDYFKKIQNKFLKSIFFLENDILIPSIKNNFENHLSPNIKTKLLLKNNVIKNQSNNYSNIQDNLEKIVPFIPINDFSDLLNKSLWDFDI